MSLVEFIILSALSLAPGRDHTQFAGILANSLASEEPLVKGDPDKLRSAALLIAIAFRESSFRLDAKSATNDFCFYQIHNRPELASDPVTCTRVAIRMLRESIRMCKSHPVAFFASGPGACSNARAQRISNDRVRLAGRIYDNGIKRKSEAGSQAVP